MFKIIGLASSIALIFCIAGCGIGDADPQDGADSNSKPTYVTMPVGTQIAVTLVDSIDTDEQVSGTEFRARLTRSIVADGHTLFADGANAVGVLNRVVESGRLKTPAELDFSLTAIEDQTGRWISVSTVIIQEKKGSHTNRQVAMIGGGALVGGIVGKIINRDGSTEIGAAAGAAAGTGLSAATGKQDIFLGAGTEIIFFSNRPSQVALR